MEQPPLQQLPELRLLNKKIKSKKAWVEDPSLFVFTFYSVIKMEKVVHYRNDNTYQTDYYGNFRKEQLFIR